MPQQQEVSIVCILSDISRTKFLPTQFIPLLRSGVSSAVENKAMIKDTLSKKPEHCSGALDVKLNAMVALSHGERSSQNSTLHYPTTDFDHTATKKMFYTLANLYCHFVMGLIHFICFLFPFTLSTHRRDIPSQKSSEQSLRTFIYDAYNENLKNTSPPREDHRRESYRLSTFQHFPASVPIDARQFAAAGFYYTGQFDEVKCFACSNTLRNLSSRTDPFLLSMHRFARGQDDCGNVRLDASRRTGLMPSGGSSGISAAPQFRAGDSTNLNAPLSQSLPQAVSLPARQQTPLVTPVNTGAIRHYQGLDIRNFQTARPVAPPQSAYDVPIYRQLATIPNPDQARLIRSLNLCRESHRFQTFTADWSSDSAPRAEDMAASGWFYLGNLDRTQCFCCGGVLRNWRRLDNPNTEHITHFPHCLMVQGHESRNIPDVDRQSFPRSPLVPNHLTDQQRADLRLMFPCESPVTSSMRSMQDRVRTYNNWHFTRATPQTLAEAGFFSLGVRDRVKCFYCNGGLQNWRQNDDPWHEHAKWYPTCEFLLQQRGPEFIHNIVARFPNLNRPLPHAAGRDVPPRPRVQSGPESLPPPPSENPVSQAPPVLSLDDEIATEIATTVIGMGFEDSLVRQVMRRKIEQNGTGYQSAAALLEAVIEAQSEQENEESFISDPSLFDTSQAAASSVEEQMEDEEQGSLYESGIDLSQVSEATNSAVQSNVIPQLSNPAELHSNVLFHSAASSIDPERFTSQPTSPKGAANVQARYRSSSSEHAESREDLAKKLKKKLEQLKDERLCKVCLDREADMVFIPCGHICCCLECTKALRMCPICRKKIEKAVRTYTS